MEYKTINQGTEEGFQDLTFTITENSYNQKSQRQIISFGIYKEENVGFGLLLAPEMLLDDPNNQKREGLFTFFQQGIEIFSLGSSSDSFVEALAELYDVKDNGWERILKILSNIGGKQKKLVMKERIPFSAVSLNQTSKDEDGTQSFKLFYDENNGQGLYSEFYINIDLQTKTLQFNEKDTGYRRNLLKAFSK